MPFSFQVFQYGEHLILSRAGGRGDRAASAAIAAALPERRSWMRLRSASRPTDFPTLRSAAMAPSSSVPSPLPWDDAELHRRVEDAIASYWVVRRTAAERQAAGGVTDTGTRGEVTGGRHLDRFCELFSEVARAAGFDGAAVRTRTGVELPGYYRATKQWDIVVARGGRLCAAIEMKSQVGPSFGNNFNNRTEEAVGSSVDFWLAYREGALGPHQPWLGYFLMVEETAGSTRDVTVSSSLFPALPAFTNPPNSSYARRYEILCERLVLERNYNAAAFLLSPRLADGTYREPNPALTVARFVRSLYGHLIACG